MTIFITVLDYCCNQVRFFQAELKENYQTEDVEQWLEDNDTDWNDSQCYYMFSIESPDVWDYTNEGIFQ